MAPGAETARKSTAATPAWPLPSSIMQRAMGVMLGLSVLLKMYRLTAPALDWHSWNQITTLANARYIYRDGLEAFLLPRVDLFSSLQGNSDILFGETPLLHALMALGYLLIGGEAEWIGRVLNIGFSLLGGVYLMRLGAGRMPAAALTMGIAVYAFSPMNLYFHRTLMTDVGMSALMVVALYYFVRWLEAGRPAAGLLSGLALGVAGLFKPYALMLGAAYLYLILRRRGWGGVVTPAHVGIALLAVTPAALWLAHGMSFYAAQPDAGQNLTTSAGLMGAWNVLWDPGYYSRLWAILIDFTLAAVFGLLLLYTLLTRLWRAVRGFWGHRRTREELMEPWPDWLWGWMLAIVVYLVLIRHGNWQHDYYQMPMLPPLALGAGLAFLQVWRGLARGGAGGAVNLRWPPWRRIRWSVGRWSLGQRILAAFVVLACVYALARSYGKAALGIDSYYAGRAVAALRQPGEKTLFYERGGLRKNQLLHYTGGKGWELPRDIPSIETLRPYHERGARYLVVSMLGEDWMRNGAPLPQLRSLEAAGHLEPVARATEHTDRYRRQRTWAVYRLRMPPPGR